MRKLFVAIFVLFALSLTGCMTASRELAQAAHPSPTLTQSYIACVGAHVDNPQVRKDCLGVVMLEADRAKGTAEAAGRAQGAEAQSNPCASWFMAPSYCYGARVNSGGYYYGTQGAAGVNYNYGEVPIRPQVVTTKPPS